MGKSTHSASPVPPDSDGAALGELLRRARERRGLTLEEISKETRIPRRHLDALERGNLSAIPGQFYRRAEIRAYADVVHLDQNLALARLEHAINAPAAREVVPEKPRRKAPPLSPLQRHLLIGCGVITAALVVWLVVGGRTPVSDDAVQAPSAPQVQQTQPAVNVAGTRVVTTVPVATAAAKGTNTASSPATPSAADTVIAPETATASGTAKAAGSSIVTSVQAPIDQGASATSDSPPAVDGSLTVLTEPAGGRVSVNGIGWGVTPLTIRNLPLGAKTIRVTKDGYAVEERAVRLASDRPTITLHIPLRSLP